MRKYAKLLDQIDTYVKRIKNAQGVDPDQAKLQEFVGRSPEMQTGLEMKPDTIKSGPSYLDLGGPKAKDKVLVKKLQDQLIVAGFMSPVDVEKAPGTFGPKTYSAVKKMQAQLGLPATGALDDKTVNGILAGSWKSQEWVSRTLGTPGPSEEK